MLCSKEPPASRPTPQPYEGCFQFETDYAGNVGNDMGVPTAGYRAGRFNLPEWHEATYAKYYQSFADRDNAERLRNVSIDMIKETSALAKLTQVRPTIQQNCFCPMDFHVKFSLEAPLNSA